MPDMESLFSKAPAATTSVDAKSLVSAVKAIQSGQKARGGKNHSVVLSHDGLTDGFERGGGTVKLPHAGAIERVGVNPKFLMDALKGAKGTVRIGTTDSNSPIHIEREDGERHLIMPVRI